MTPSRDQRLANLAAANHLRHESKRRAVTESLAAMVKAMDRVNVSQVAQRSGVSRNFIYAQSDLLSAIQDAATGQPHRLHRPRPTPTAEANLRARLVTALDELGISRQKIGELEATVERLTLELTQRVTDPRR